MAGDWQEIHRLWVQMAATLHSMDWLPLAEAEAVATLQTAYRVVVAAAQGLARGLHRVVLLRLGRVMWVVHLFRRNNIFRVQVVVEQAQRVSGLVVANRERRGQVAVGFYGIILITQGVVAGDHIELTREQPLWVVMAVVVKAVGQLVALVLWRVLELLVQAVAVAVATSQLWGLMEVAGLLLRVTVLSNPKFSPFLRYQLLAIHFSLGANL